MKHALLGMLLASLLFPLHVAADPAADRIEPPPARAVVGFGGTSVTTKDVFLLRTRFHVGAEITHESRLTISPFLRMYATRIDLVHDDELPLDLTLTLPLQPVIGGRVEYRLLERKWFDLAIRGEFESPLTQNTATISGYRPYDKLVTAPIKENTLQQHLEVRHLWRGASTSLLAGATFGRFHLRVELGYLMLQSSLAVTFDPTFAALLDAADVKPDRFYDDGASAPFYAASAEIDLGDGFQLRGGGTVMVAGGKIYAAAELSIAVPVDTRIF